jgi:hypothetical protein
MPLPRLMTGVSALDLGTAGPQPSPSPTGSDLFGPLPSGQEFFELEHCSSPSGWNAPFTLGLTGFEDPTSIALLEPSAQYQYPVSCAIEEWSDWSDAHSRRGGSLASSPTGTAASDLEESFWAKFPLDANAVRGL